MSQDSQDSVALLKWSGEPDRVIQDVNWVLEDREDSTNQLRATTTLAEADGIEEEQELIFQGRRFIVFGVERYRHTDRATIVADEAQVELAGHVLKDFEFTSWTAFQALEHALKDTRWTPGEVVNVRYGRAQFEDLTVLEACHFLANHQDAYVTFDSLRRRVNLSSTRGTAHEHVFTYGRELANIEKESEAPVTTVIYPTGADDMTIASVNGGRDYVEDYGYYTSRGISLADARRWYRKEEHWEDNRYEIPENMKRDAEKRLAEEAYPAITYTLVAEATTSVDGTDDFDLTTIGLGDRVYVWDEEIDTKLVAEVASVTTSSDASENELVLATLPESFGGTGRRGSGRYFGDSGSTAGNPLFPRSGFQPRPSMPILESLTDVGVGAVRWNGQDHDGNYTTIPVRFGSVIPVVAKVAEDGSIPSPDSDDAYEGTRINSRGGGLATVAFGTPGSFAVWFYMLGNDQHTRSEYSEPLVVEVDALVDTEQIQDDIDSAKRELEETIEAHGNREGTEPPADEAPPGVVYYQKDSNDQVVGIWQARDDGSWIVLPLNSAVLANVTTDKLVAGEALIGGVLIGDNEIKLRNIEVTEELMAALLRVKKIEAGDIEANAIDGMTITGGVVKGGRIEGSEVHGAEFHGGTYRGGHMIAPLIETHEGRHRGVKIDESGYFFGYDNQGRLTTSIGGPYNRLAGRIATGVGDQPGIIMTPVEFDSSGRSGIWFVPDVSQGIGGSGTPGIYIQNPRATQSEALRLQGRGNGGIEVNGPVYATTGTSLFNVIRQGGSNPGYRIQAANGSFFEGQTDFRGQLRNPGATSTGQSANVHMDGNGRLWRRSSSTRYKLDQEIMDISDDLLDLELKTWYDKPLHDEKQAVLEKLFNGEELEELDRDTLDTPITRTPGVIGEELAQIDDRFVVFDADGNVLDVQYERLGLAWIPIVRRQKHRIDQLEAKVDDLETRLEKLEQDLTEQGV